MWNKQNDIKNSLSTIKIAMKISVSSEDAIKFKKNFDELFDLEKKYRGILICFFCEKQSPNDGAQIKKTIYKETHRSYFPRRVEYSYLDVDIPRCDSCQIIHSKGDKQKIIFMIVGAVTGIIIGAMVDEHFILGGLLGLGITFLGGPIIASNTYSSSKIKDNSYSTLSSHPIIQNKIIQGWTFSKPSA
jgi:hypothetical protein